MGPVIEIALGSGTPMTQDEKSFFKQLGETPEVAPPAGIIGRLKNLFSR